MEKKELRNGYTTGSCAAAAAKAAALMLGMGRCPETVDITLPGKEKATFNVQKVYKEKEDSVVSCFRVLKDSGDDPDVTDKTYIYAACRAVSKSDIAKLKAHGRGYLMDGEPSIYIDGGPGIGLVTEDGLSCPVGHYAINPVPRDEIALAVREACDMTGQKDDLLITLAVPGGESIASKTFNPRLGITGGISILGTSGIVRPMSEDAVLQTIKLELHMKAAGGDKSVIIVPGNYGETFLKKRFGIPEGTAVQISNYVRDSVLMACDEGFERILFAGHAGKLIKVAAGFPNTHSRYGDKRMETFLALLESINCQNASDDKASSKTIEESIMKAVTTDEALEILARACGARAEKIVASFLGELAKAVKRQMEEWSNGRILTEVIVFSREESFGATPGVGEYFSI